MAKRRPEDPPKGFPAWQGTFADLMNLLLCFFVMLFSMSNMDAQKFELLAASFNQTFSIFSAGASAIGDGLLISNGVSLYQQYRQGCRRGCDPGGSGVGGRYHGAGEAGSFRRAC